MVKKRKAWIACLLSLVMMAALLGGVLATAPFVSAASAVATPITAANAAQLRIKTEDNILTDALLTGFVTSGGSAVPKPYLFDNQLGGLDFDGPVDGTNANRGYAISASSKPYNYLQIDMEEEYDFTSFLYGGYYAANSRSCGGIEIYVGDKTKEEIEAGGVTPDFTYTQDIHHLRVDFAQPLRGRYMVVKCYAVNSNTVIFFTEFGATGKPVAAAADGNAATPITAANADQLRIKTEDNILTDALLTGFVTSGGSAVPKPYLFDNQLGGLDFDSPVDDSNANRGYAINASSKPYNYLQIDMEEEYDFTSFLFGGYYAANSRSCGGIEIYVGDKTKDEIEADGATPDFTYMQDIHHLRVDFAQPLRGRYMVVKCYAVNSNTFIFFTEFGATGTPVAVPVPGTVATPITAANAAQLRIPTEDNILTDALLTGFVTSGGSAVPKPYLFDNQLGELDFATVELNTNANRGFAINASSNPYNYLQIDMGEEYDFTSFLFGGYYAANSRSCGGIEIYVGDKTKDEIEADGATPDFTYMQDIHHLRVDFAQPLRGRYMVVKCYAVNSNTYIFFTELGATGTPVPKPVVTAPVETLGAQVRDVDEAGRTALRFGFTLSCTGVGYEDETHAGNNYHRALDNATVTVGGKEYTLVDFGAIVTLKEDVELTKEAADGGTVKEVPALNLFEAEDGQVTYTAVLVNIPATAASRQIYARSYVTYQDGETTHTIYGDVISRCVDDCGAGN